MGVTGMHPETERWRSTWDRHAADYDRSMSSLERRLLAGDREWASSRVSGRTLEVAVGTGRNLRHLDPAIELVGLDASEGMLAVARHTAAEQGRNVDLRFGDAMDLPFADRSFDTVLITYSLCSVADDLTVLREIHRVLRPGGQLVAVEHVASDRGWVRAVQRLLDPLTRRFQGDHLLRDTARVAQRAGLTVVTLERRRLGLIVRLVARR